MTLVAETEQRVRLVGLTDPDGDLVDNALVQLTVTTRSGDAIAGLDSVAMSSEGAGTGNYSYVIPASIPLNPDVNTFGCTCIIAVSQLGVLKLTKYLPLLIEKNDG
jgi:hypothetical protein